MYLTQSKMSYTTDNIDYLSCNTIMSKIKKAIVGYCKTAVIVADTSPAFTLLTTLCVNALGQSNVFIVQPVFSDKANNDLNLFPDVMKAKFKITNTSGEGNLLLNAYAHGCKFNREAGAFLISHKTLQHNPYDGVTFDFFPLADLLSYEVLCLLKALVLYGDLPEDLKEISSVPKPNIAKDYLTLRLSSGLLSQKEIFSFTPDEFELAKEIYKDFEHLYNSKPLNNKVTLDRVISN